MYRLEKVEGGENRPELEPGGVGQGSPLPRPPPLGLERTFYRRVSLEGLKREQGLGTKETELRLGSWVFKNLEALGVTTKQFLPPSSCR